MDTDWYAVDADGHVALFVSGEDGAVPRAAFEDDGLFEALSAARAETGGDVFRFGHEQPYDPGLYWLKRAPDRPVSLEQLPASVRDGIAKVRFPVSFATVQTLHLADYMRDEDARVWLDDGRLRWPEDE